MFRNALLVLATSALCAPALQAQPPKKLRSAGTAEIQKVVKAITREIEANANQATPIKGDELIEKLVKVAAVEAGTIEQAAQVEAFCVALSVALDPANTLALNVVTKQRFGGLETQDEVKSRRALMKKAPLKMRDRSDWALHWALSVGLTARLGAKEAEAFGVAKEQLDLKDPKGSGWSFTDLSADFSGIAFASRLISGDIKLKDLEEKFTVKRVIADPAGLEESLKSDAFEKTYKTFQSTATKKAIRDVQKRVDEHFKNEWEPPKKK